VIHELGTTRSTTDAKTSREGRSEDLTRCPTGSSERAVSPDCADRGSFWRRSRRQGSLLDSNFRFRAIGFVSKLCRLSAELSCGESP